LESEKKEFLVWKIQMQNTNHDTSRPPHMVWIKNNKRSMWLGRWQVRMLEWEGVWPRGIYKS
jgi:hypothetical protein